MQRLGHVHVFTENDLDLVATMTHELYALPTPDEQACRAQQASLRRKDRIRRWIFRQLARGSTSPPHPVPLDGRRVHKVLLFRYDRFGDYIITTAMIEWLRAAIPDVIIDVVASTGNRRMIEADPRVRRVVAIDPSDAPNASWLHVRRLGKQERYDVVIAAVFMKMTKAAILARLAARDALRVTVRHPERHAIYEPIFQANVPRIPGEHWALTMARIGENTITPIQSVHAGVAQPNIYLDAAACSGTWQWLANNGLTWMRHHDARICLATVPPSPPASARPYVFVNISAQGDNRQWASRSALPVIRGIRTHNPDVCVVVSGAPSEQADVASLVQAADDADVIMWSGSIADMMVMISGALLLVSPDTATVHVAAAARTPCVVLYAELIKLAEWYPYGTTFRAIVSADPETVNDIPTATILNAISSLLSAH